MEIRIENNPLRILGCTFMYIHPVVKREEFNYRMLYSVTHVKYGRIGEAELVTSFPRPLFDIPKIAQFLAEGDMHLIDRMKANGFSHTQEIQVCTFRMTKYFSGVTEMLTKECAKMKIPFSTQTQLL